MKKMMKEKTIKTAAIGLSAIMAMSTPMTAMAAEGEGAIPTEPTDPVKENQKGVTKNEELAKEVDGIQKEASDLTAEADSTKEAGSVKEAEDAEKKAVDLSNQEGIKKPVEEAGDKLDKATTNKEDKNKATKDIENTKDLLKDAKDEIQKMESGLNKAEDEVDNINTVTKKANDDIDNAQTNVQNEIDKIKNAGTLDEAKKAADQAKDIADQANTDLGIASDNVKKAEAAYQKAEDAALEAETAYKEALKNAEGESTEALKNLQEAAKKAKDLELKAKHEVKKAKLTAADQAALAIIEKQNEIDKMGTEKWHHEDILFKQIMNDYYIPNVVELPEGQTITLDSDFERFKGEHEKNYIKAFVKDKKGNIIDTKYYNYRLDETRKKLIIFEKTEKVTQEATEDKYVVYGENSAIARELTKEQFDELKKKNDIVEVEDENGSKYYAKKVDDKNNVAAPVEETTKELINNETTEQVVTDEKTETMVTTDGKIVEQTTGTVTTTTKVKDVSLDGAKDFTSEEAAKKAAEDEAKGKLNEGDTLTNVNAEITATATSTVEVSYVTTFTTTVDLTGMTTTVGVFDDSRDAIDEIEDNALDGMKDAFRGNNSYKVLSKEVKNVQVKRIEDKIFDTYKATSGTLTVTYKKVNKIKVDQWLVEKIFKGTAKQEDYIKARVPEGSQILDYDAWDWDFGNGTGYYLKGNKVVETVSVTDKDASTAKENAYKEAAKKAEDAAKKQANASIDKNFENALKKNVNNKGSVSTSADIYSKLKNKVNWGDQDKKYNVAADMAVEAKESNSTVKYSYSGTFDKEEKKVEKDVTLNSKTWDADELTFEEGQEEVRTLTNENYDNYMAGKGNNVFLEATDEGFNKFLNDAKNKADILKKHQDIVDAARDAKIKAREAAIKVDNLRNRIRDLETKSTTTTKELNILKGQLEIALEDFGKAKEKAGKLDDLLEKSKEALDDAEKRLTPAPTPTPAPATPAGPTTPTTPAGPTTPVAPVATPAVVTITPAATPLAANVADADADADVEGNGVVIDDNETPLAGEMEAEVEDGDEEITSIEDTEVPMATAEEDGMSWWWLLLIAILGATGYEMYKKHQAKKAALSEELNK